MVKEIIEKIKEEKVHKKLVEGTKEFKSEFKKQTGTAIITAFGLVIALAWKGVIDDIIAKFKFAQGILISALILTAISVIGILIVSKWANSENKK